MPDSRFSFRVETTLAMAALSLLLVFPATGYAAQQATDEINVSADDLSPEASRANFDTLVKQLDSTSFKEREAATSALVELGPEILEPITIHFFNASSEAGWRIQRILEGIGKAGEEKDFLKSIAIIQLLYGAQDLQSQRRLAQLQYQWKISRRNEAAKKLRQAGFKFESTEEVSPHIFAMEEARIAMMLRAAAVRELPETGTLEAPNPLDSAEAPSATRWENPRKNRRESMQQVERIIAGDTTANRKIVESLMPPAFQVSLPPGTLEISDEWDANEESKQLIHDLGELSNLTLTRQKINASLQKFISNQTKLTSLRFTNCEFDKASRKLVLPKSIQVLQFEGALPPAASFASLSIVSTMELNKVKLDEKVSSAISNCKIQTLALNEVEFTRESIQRLVGIGGLFRVTMSLCQFELDWLEDIRQKNPNLIIAAPKAFLGVQGPNVTSRELTACQISEVVPDTAASSAGMLALDVVTAMDGTKISRFEDLRLLISQKRPGETMELQIRRGDRNLKLNVKLGAPPEQRVQ